MTEPTEPRTYRTSTGRVLTDADIERIAEEVETTDFDPAIAKILYPPDRRRASRNASMKSTRDP